MPTRYHTYEEFWPYYVTEHAKPSTRALHFVGTTLVIVALIAAAVVSPWFLLAAPFAGYLFAWIGHFGFEKNRPATFTYPLWSLRADFRMYRLMLLGKMEAELEHATRRHPRTQA